MFRLTRLSLPSHFFPGFSGNSYKAKDVTLENKADDHFEHWIDALACYFNQLFNYSQGSVEILKILLSLTVRRFLGNTSGKVTFRKKAEE